MFVCDVFWWWVKAEDRKAVDHPAVVRWSRGGMGRKKKKSQAEEKPFCA